jgi:hypothetical protein
MTVQVAVLVAVISGAMIWWYRMNAQTRKDLAQFKAETERLHAFALLSAQEKFNRAELALGKDKGELSQQAYDEAVYELNVIKNAL